MRKLRGEIERAKTGNKECKGRDTERKSTNLEGEGVLE